MGRTRHVGFAIGLATWLLSSVLAAQTLGRIEGRLTNADGDPLSGVHVRVAEEDVAAVTSHEGRFSLGLADGTYTVIFELADREERVEDVAVPIAGAVRLEHQVDWDLTPAEMAIVTGLSQKDLPFQDATAAVSSRSSEDVARDAATGSLPKLLEFGTGVRVSQSSLHQASLDTRGLAGRESHRLGVRLDGRDTSYRFFGTHEWYGFSLPVEELSRVELLRGSPSVLYGPNTSSGVLSLVTRTASAGRGGGIRVSGGELSTLNADLRWAFPITDQWYGKVLAGYRSSDDFTLSRNRGVEYSTPCDAVGDTDCLPLEAVAVDPLGDDQLASGAFRLDRHSPYGAGLMTLEAGASTVEGPVYFTDLGRTQTEDVLWTWARADYSTAHWEFLGSYNSRNSDNERVLTTGYEISLDDESWQFEARTHWTFFEDRLRLLGGLSYRDETLDTRDAEGRTRPLMLNPLNRQTLLFERLNTRRKAAYLELDWQLGERVKLVVGARWDDLELPALIPPEPPLTADQRRSSRDEEEISPKAALVWSPTENHSFRVAYHESFDIPDYSQLYLQADVADPINLAFLEPYCALDGVPCGFDVDFVFGEEPDQDTTPETRILAVGNERLLLEEVKTAEVGYAGRLGRGSLLTLDVYTSENKNVASGLLPQIGTSLGRVNGDFDAYVVPEDVLPENRDAILDGLEEALGDLRPFLTQNIDGTPFLAMSTYATLGTLDTFGVDLGFRWQSPAGFVLGMSGSYFDYEIQDVAEDLESHLLPNAPELTAQAEIGYAGRAWGTRAQYRWVDDFRWKAGLFEGDVASYGILDLTGDWRLADHWSLGFHVSNLLDEDQFQTFGGDLLGRRALATLAFDW